MGLQILHSHQPRFLQDKNIGEKQLAMKAQCHQSKAAELKNLVKELLDQKLMTENDYNLFRKYLAQCNLTSSKS